MTDVLLAPFLWQDSGLLPRAIHPPSVFSTGVEHHDTLTGPVQIVFAHGTFLAKKVCIPLTQNSRVIRRLGDIGYLFFTSYWAFDVQSGLFFLIRPWNNFEGA